MYNLGDTIKTEGITGRDREAMEDTIAFQEARALTERINKLTAEARGVSDQIQNEKVEGNKAELWEKLNNLFADIKILESKRERNMVVNGAQEIQK